MTTRIHIILPNRIGDSILTLPALLCLKRLVETYGTDPLEITLFTHVPLTGLMQALELVEFRPFSIACKLASWLTPPHKAFFLSTTSRNIGYRAKTSFGLRLPNKRTVRYDVNLPYLDGARCDSLLPRELLDFLRFERNLPPYSLRPFGLCLELGFTVRQIKDVFRFDNTSLVVNARYFDRTPPVSPNYVVFCMEAAYGKRRAGYRRWPEEYFFNLAERLFVESGLESVFVGLHDEPPLPARRYMKDTRGRLTLDQIAQLLHYSRGYLGNDTGPLHLANLLRKKTIGMYSPDAEVVYRPLFPQFNTACPISKKPEDIYPLLGQYMTEGLEPLQGRGAQKTGPCGGGTLIKPPGDGLSVIRIDRAAGT